MKTVKKYKITIECQDKLKNLKVWNIYLTEEQASRLYLMIFDLYDKQLSEAKL